MLDLLILWPVLRNLTSQTIDTSSSYIYINYRKIESRIHLKCRNLEGILHYLEDKIEKVKCKHQLKREENKN